jgi:hypothetical protein
MAEDAAHLCIPRGGLGPPMSRLRFVLAHCVGRMLLLPTVFAVTKLVLLVQAIFLLTHAILSNAEPATHIGCTTAPLVPRT